MIRITPLLLVVTQLCCAGEARDGTVDQDQGVSAEDGGIGFADGGVLPCGNGILEQGEQCEAPFDLCCDPTSCTYKTADMPCRAQAGECDAAEICPGDSAACPDNVLAANDTACATGTCLDGVCKSADAGEEVSLGPTDDASVREDYPDNNYGSAANLGVGYPGSYQRQALLKFDLSEVQGSVVQSATLRLYKIETSQANNIDSTIDASEVSDDSWSESTVTWNTMPALGAVVVSGMAAGSGWIELDVTSYVHGEFSADPSKVVSFGLSTTQQTPEKRIDIFSEEYPSQSVRPRLHLISVPEAICGNGIIEAEEQCEAPFGLCCDAATCQLGSAGSVCREDTGPCDVAETCSGDSDACPADSFEPNDSACPGGACQGGACR